MVLCKWKAHNKHTSFMGCVSTTRSHNVCLGSQPDSLLDVQASFYACSPQPATQTLLSFTYLWSFADAAKYMLQKPLYISSFLLDVFIQCTRLLKSQLGKYQLLKVPYYCACESLYMRVMMIRSDSQSNILYGCTITIDNVECKLSSKKASKRALILSDNFHRESQTMDLC